MKYLRILTHYGSGWRDYVDTLIADERFALVVTEDQETFEADYQKLIDAGEVFDIIDSAEYTDDAWFDFYMNPSEKISSSMGAAYADKWLIHVMFASSGIPKMPLGGEKIAFLRDPRVAWPFVNHIGITPKMLANAAAMAVKGLPSDRIMIHARVMSDVSNPAEEYKISQVVGFDVDLDLFPIGYGLYVTEKEAEASSIRPYKDHVPDWETTSAKEVWEEIESRAGLAILAAGNPPLTFEAFEASRGL